MEERSSTREPIENGHICTMIFRLLLCQPKSKTSMTCIFQMQKRERPKPDPSTKIETSDSNVPKKTKGCLTKILSQYKKPYVASSRYDLIQKRKIS